MIENIEIQNFKSIKEANVLLKNINLLVGANGAGKSNFISFLKLLVSIKDFNLNRYVLDSGYMSNLIYFGKKDGIYLRGAITFSLGDGKKLKYQFKLAPDRNNRAYIDTENLHVSTKDQNGYKKIIEDNLTAGSTFFSEGDPNFSQDLTDCFDSLAIYHFHDTSALGLRATSMIDNNSSLKEDGINLSAFLYLIYQTHPQTFNTIEKVIKSVFPQFKRFRLAPDRGNSLYIKLEWQEESFDQYQNAYNFSEGTLRFIALVTVMLQPNPPKVIIIDEPELGLHPSAIETLAGLVRKVSAKSQIILATQSIQLVNNFEPEDIIVVDRDRENRQSIFTRADEIPHIQLQDWLEEYGLGEIWFKGLIGGKP
ncbi:MAG: AAA family ATPase [Haliscomenobacter sp.]|uniref:AAA family ATPase n=1 Tax=Haliscomenobacter sp. TaxID=2717303 RepID=UPI0029B7FCD7|nr:AAA family ATPase [Haliscomenobacter sp.]MDX2069221.1 AAA family ATPase [Haliscomenobacter sp.]